MQKKLSWFNKLPIGLIFLLIAGFLLRMWRLAELFHFTYDEEIIAFVGKRMFVNWHIPLIGGVTPMHVHLAPYFYWLSGFWLFLSGLNPLGWGVLSALLSLATTCLLYKIGKSAFGKRMALVAVFIYTFSFFQNIFDRHYWGLVFNGIISLVSMYSLWQMARGNIKYIYLLVLSLSFGFHTDPSTLSLLVMALVVLLFLKIRVSWQIAGKALLIFLLSFLPLIIFDLRHNFANISGIKQYLSEIKQGQVGVIKTTSMDAALLIPRILARTINISPRTDLAKLYSYCPAHVESRLKTTSPVLVFLVIAVLVSGLIVGIYEKNREQKQAFTIINSLFMAAFAGSIIYGFFLKGDLFDHYLSVLFPAFYLLVAVLLVKLFRQRVWILIGLGVIFLIINVVQLGSAYHSFGFADKTRAVKWAISTVGTEDFSLDVIGDCYKYNGYRYLFYLYGKEPLKSYVDANFTHLYDKKPAIYHPKYLVVLTNPDDNETNAYYQEYAKYKQKLLTSSQFGKIEVLLVDNSKLDFVGKF